MPASTPPCLRVPGLRVPCVLSSRLQLLKAVGAFTWGGSSLQECAWAEG